jgi:phosphoglycolate phosphatase
MEVKTIIFDFDGTIADSFVTFIQVFEDITSREQKLTEDEINNLRGLQVKQILKYLKIKNWQIPRLAIKARKEVAAKIIDIKPFKGIAGALSALHGEGYKMFILSSNDSKNISKFLKTNNLDSYFSGIHGGIGLHSKSAVLKKVLRKEKIKSDQCIYIGDEVRDIEAAKKAKIQIISVGWGFNNPEALEKAAPNALAKTPSELFTIINNL